MSYENMAYPEHPVDYPQDRLTEYDLYPVNSDWDTRTHEAKPSPLPYKVERIPTEGGENTYDLLAKLQKRLNEEALNNYHPIKIDSPDKFSYHVIFYHMPNGPAFTPPF